MPVEAILKPTGEFKQEIGTHLAAMEEIERTGFSGPLSAYKADYLRMGDPTEYRFAVRHIPGGWPEWENLLSDRNLFLIVSKWREELAQKLSSEALLRILEAAQGETRDALSANKYIYEALSSKEDKKAKVGRPTKEAIHKEAVSLMEDERIREEAYKRIFK